MNLPRATSHALLGLLALVTALGPSPAVAQPAAVSPIFQVNTYTEGDQLVSAVAGNGNGRFVAVWSSGWIYEPQRPTQDGSGFGVYAQVYDASGARIGAEIPVNQTTAGNQDESDVAMDADGGFVVVWRSETPVTFESRILGRRFSPTGVPLGNEFEVSGTIPPSRDFHPAIALDGEGGFVVAWKRYGSGVEEEIYARRFDAAGSPLGAPFEVSVDERGQPDRPAVALGPAGDFSVIYEIFGLLPGRDGGLLARRFTAGGEPVGDAVVLDVPPRFRPLYPAAASRPDGGAVVVWLDGFDVFGRRLDPAGAPQGLAFPASTRSGELANPRVTVDAAGGFLVAWTEFDDQVNGLGVFGQRFDASGARQGVEFRLDTGAGSSAVGGPVATIAPNGDFVAAWTDGRQRELDGPDGSGYGVFARLFRLPPLGADACLAGDGHLACDTLRDGGDADLDLEITAQPGDLPLAGNLDGDVRDDLCLYRDGRFLCDTAHDGGTPEVTIAFGGAAVDVPLLGDINGDGKDDACVRRRRRFLCDTAHNGGTAEVQILFGRPADTPLLGDVDGDGDDDPCLYRAGRFSCDTVHDGREAEVGVSFGSVNDVPLLGDLDNDGDDDFCVFTGDRFRCDTAHDGGAAEVEIPFAGSSGTVPVLGNLDGF